MKDRNFANQRKNLTASSGFDYPTVFTTLTNSKRAALINNSIFVILTNKQFDESLSEIEKLYHSKNISFSSLQIDDSALGKSETKKLQNLISNLFKRYHDSKKPYVLLYSDENETLNNLFKYVDVSTNVYQAIVDHIHI